MNRIINIATIILVITFISSCAKEFDEPPVMTIPAGDLISLEEIRNLYAGAPVGFDANKTVIATVIADEASGNLYREVYIDDGTAAIILRLANSGLLDEGDQIRINLTNLVVDEFAGTMQIQTADGIDDVTIIDNDVAFTAVNVDLSTLLSNHEAYEAKLVQIDNVEFSSSNLGDSYAITDPEPFSVNTTVVDCDGVETIIRTSGFSNFANETIANGNGTLFAVVSEFNGEVQLKIRDLDDVQFDGLRCNEDTTTIEGQYLNQTWSSSNIFNGGWTTQLVTGLYNWETSSLGAPDNAPYASIDNYDGGNTASEAWLISPAMDLTAAVSPKLTFISAVGFTGDDMEVYVSSDYDGVSAPSSATWNILDPTLASNDPDFFAWTESGDVDLSAYNGSSAVYVGFRYTGSDSDGATWELDDVLVTE